MPERARSISVSVDRVTVPMEEPVRLRKGAAPDLGLTTAELEQIQARRGQPLEPRVRSALREAARTTKRCAPKIARNFRMAYCRLCADVRAPRAHRAMPVVLLADGAVELWNLFGRHLNERTLGVAPIELVDAWHALEYIAAAARFLEAKGRLHAGAYRRWRKRPPGRRARAPEKAQSFRDVETARSASFLNDAEYSS